MGGFQHAALRPKTKHRQHNTEDTAQIILETDHH